MGGETISTAPKTTAAAAKTNHQSRTHQTPRQDGTDDTIVCALAFLPIVITVVILVCIGYSSSTNDPTLQINSVSVSPFNQGQISPRTNFHINFTVRNPGFDRDLIYDNTVLYLHYKKELISLSMLAPLHQDPREENSIRVSVGSVSSHLENWVGSALAKGTRGRAVTLGVRVESRVKYDPGKSSEEIKGIEVFCEDVKIKFPADGGVKAGEPVDCRVVMVKDY